MNAPQIFNNEQFGKIRVFDIDGNPWFIGKDVAAALGYGDTDKAIRTHVDDEDKVTRRFGGEPGSKGGNPNMTIINESGLYSLIFSSKLDRAKDFKHLVTAEVLPTLRKEGAYTIGSLPPEVSAGGVAELIRVTRRAMLDSGYTPQDVMSMVKHQYQVWCIPVPPPMQHPAQLNLFGADYPQAIEGGATE